MAKTYWNKQAASYVDSKGKVIDYKEVRSAINAVRDDTGAKLRSLTQSFIDGKKTLPAWATESEALIKNSILSAGQIAAGGKSQLTNSLNGQLGAKVKFHLGKFREMGLARERGEVSDAQLLARSDQYANAIANVFEQMRLPVMVNAGYTEVRNIPGASEKPCSECPQITAKGWMLIADYKPPGMRECKGGDKCGSEYRKGKAA